MWNRKSLRDEVNAHVADEYRLAIVVLGLASFAAGFALLILSIFTDDTPALILMDFTLQLSLPCAAFATAIAYRYFWVGFTKRQRAEFAARRLPLRPEHVFMIWGLPVIASVGVLMELTSEISESLRALERSLQTETGGQLNPEVSQALLASTLPLDRVSDVLAVASFVMLVGFLAAWQLRYRQHLRKTKGSLERGSSVQT